MFGALDARFIGYRHDAVLITFLYISVLKKWGAPPKKARCDARGGAHDPGEQIYIYFIYSFHVLCPPIH